MAHRVGEDLRTKEDDFRRSQEAMANVTCEDENFSAALDSYFRAKTQLYYARGANAASSQGRQWTRRALAVERTYRALKEGYSTPPVSWLPSKSIRTMIGYTFNRVGDGKPVRVVSLYSRRSATHLVIECDGERRSAHHTLIRAASSKAVE